MENNNTNSQNHSQKEHEAHSDSHGHSHEKHEHDHPHHHEDEVKLPADRSKLIKIALVVAAVVVLGGLVYSFKGLFIAAMVNGELVSRHSVVKELERQGGRHTLDNLINKSLIESEAKSKNISVSDEEVNAEIKKFEDQFAAVGQNIDDVLAMENLTRDELKNQVAVRIMIEKLVSDKAGISDEDLNKYITDSQVTLPAGQEEETKNQIREQMKQEKLATLSMELIEQLRAKAKIYDFSNYKGGTQPQ